MLDSGAQQPLTHCSWFAHRAAQLTPVTVEFTQIAFAQQSTVWHWAPGAEHEPPQYLAGAHTADVPSMSTVQHPLLH